MPVLCAKKKPKNCATVHVNLDIPEMEGIAKVDFAFLLLQTVNMFLRIKGVDCNPSCGNAWPGFLTFNIKG